jgi:DNA invertase Pin-like site-specific DNA recombinase
MKPIHYFVYTRKSTEDEERQVKSVEDQLTEINEFAHRERLKIAEYFTEDKSAKMPGRKVFNQMLEKIYASKEPVGIIAWHPDRLARNSVDGGQIIYLVDIQKVVSLKFPTFWFEPTSQGKFMLQVSFSQSKYYSDSLSENVRRGIRQKIRRGEYATHAPFGLVNNKETKNIEPVPTEAKVIRKAFDEFAEGRHSLTTMSQRLAFWGFVNSKGKPFGKAQVHRLLTNPTYIGLIQHHGELHEGKFEPIVDKATFEAVQIQLKKKSKPRKQKAGKNFPFTGLLKCGECGGMITAQYAKKGKYIYYRCTKRMGVKCSQPYVSDVVLLAQLQAEISKVALPEGWSEIALAHIDKRQQESREQQQSFCQNLQVQIKETEAKLDKLVNSFLDGLIEQETYLRKKEELLKTKVELNGKSKDFGKKGAAWFELSREWVKAASSAGKLASSNDLAEIKSFLKKNGSNRHLRDKKVGLSFVRPFDLLSKYRGLKENTPSLPDGVLVTSREEVTLSRVLIDDVLTYFREQLTKPNSPTR